MCESRRRLRRAARTVFVARALLCISALATLSAASRDAHAFTLCGDATGEGRVSATDALVTLTVAVSSEYRPELDLAAAETGEPPDGRVTATDALRLLDASVASAIPGCAAADRSTAIVSSAACDFGTGGLAEVSVADLDVIDHRIGSVDADSVVRVIDDRVFVINRFDGSSVQEIDLANDLSTLWRCSVGAGSNPHDLALVAPNKAYVSRYDATSIAIVDPSVAPSCAGFVTGTIDLSDAADADGIPEMDQMLLVGDRLFVAVQRLNRDDFFRPATNGALVVVDTTTDEIVGTVELAISNPFAETKGLAYDQKNDRILVGGPGTLFSELDDGGIEAVDATNLVSLGVLLDGADLGGELLDFAMLGSDRGYAIVADGTFVAHVVAIDLEAGLVGEPLLTSSQNVSDLEVSEDGRLWVVDRNCFDPGLRVFAVGTGVELTTEPIYPGLTPFNIDFAR